MRTSKLAWWLLAPMLLLVGVFAVYPIVRMVGMSFTTQNLETGLTPVFAGTSNYQRAWSDTHFWETVWRTLVFTISAVSLELLLGLCAALALHHSPVGRGFARTAALVPWVLPTSALALGWIWIFNDQFGVVNDLLMRFGILSSPFAWLGHPGSAFGAVILADVWKTTPFLTILVLAGLQTIPSQLYEAAALDGASRWRRFLHITLPLLRPVIFVAVLFRMLQSFGVFDLVYVMTGGGPGGATETVALYIYRNFMRYHHFGYGAALLVLSSCILAVLAAGLWALLGRNRQLT
jgi:multiple sugar transport system permease protein